MNLKHQDEIKKDKFDTFDSSSNLINNQYRLLTSDSIPHSPQFSNSLLTTKNYAREGDTTTADVTTAKKILMTPNEMQSTKDGQNLPVIESRVFRYKSNY